MIYNRFTVAGVLLLAAVVSPLAAPASGRHAPCQCVTAPDALLESTDAVFVGDLLQVKRGDDGEATAIIRVRESFKGGLEGVVEVEDGNSDGCGWSVFEMATPGRFMVFANREEGRLVTPSVCPQTQPIRGWQDRLSPFRAYARAQAHQIRTARSGS